MTRNHLVSLVVLTLFLTGCVGMPLTSMLQLRRMDPMEIDAAQFKVAIRADERIGIPKDGVHLSLKFDATDGSLNIDDTYVVEVIRDPVFTPELFDNKATWQSITMLQLSDSDAEKMTRVQSLLKPYTEGRASGSLSFGVDVKGVCAHSPIPTSEVLIDIFVQASDSKGFFAVTRGLDLRQSVDEADPVLEGFSQCLEGPVHSNRDQTVIPMGAPVTDR